MSSSLDTLVEIQGKLADIKAKLEEGKRKSSANREASIALIRFITDTVNAVAPHEIKAQWSGSYTNYDAANYPVLIIHALHRATLTILATWSIDAGGDYPAQNITQDEIIAAVLKGLDKVQTSSIS
jgi:hypothetical protein